MATALQRTITLSPSLHLRCYLVQFDECMTHEARHDRRLYMFAELKRLNAKVKIHKWRGS